MSGWRATYRLQLHREFPLPEATKLVPYLDRLGVSHLYVSPILRARAGSLHGYDVVDTATLNPELGSEEDLEKLRAALEARGMGLLLDIVPNHMGIGRENAAWDDVLAHGAESAFAEWFDIDWEAGRGRLVLPLLGMPLRLVIERDELVVSLEEGEIRLCYFEHSLPLRPATQGQILTRALARLRSQGRDDAAAALARIEEQLRRLSRTAASHRRRAGEEATQELAELIGHSADVRAAVADAGSSFTAGDEGRRRLRRLLRQQAYRLVHWQRASREVNYRRFFNVNDLAGVRQEDPSIFQETHRRIFEWLQRRIPAGLRVDHVDGLADPAGYLRRLRGEIGRRVGTEDAVPVYVEKILSGDESLPLRWATAGSTGYEFVNDLGAIFVDPQGFRRIEAWYRRRILGRRGPENFLAAARAGKRMALDRLLYVDIDRVTRLMHAALLPEAAAIGVGALREALIEVVVCLSVYRTYVGDDGGLTPAEAARIDAAVSAARRRRRASGTALDTVAAFLRPAADAEDDTPNRVAVRRRLEQVSGPAAAKGVEDTALYVYVPLVSRNEVGVEPDAPPEKAAERLHEANSARAARWPRNLLCVSTHDTKRSADVRARLSVLAEIPERWIKCVERWRRLNQRHKHRVGRARAPDPNTEYLLYQTMVGMWPVTRAGEVPPRDEFAALRERIEYYMVKAGREAKVHTSWRKPRVDFETALIEFVRAVMDPDTSDIFLRDVARLVGEIARPGLWMSLARTLVQLTAPGIPDIYRGDELWRLRLVDPDNRRPVDFERRLRLLQELERSDGEEADGRLRDLVVSCEDGRIKLFLIWKMLSLRRRLPALFGGAYEALEVEGSRRDAAFAFLRSHAAGAVVVIVPRRSASIASELSRPPVGADVWGDTAVRVPESYGGSRFRCALTGREVCPRRGGAVHFPIAEVLTIFPAAVLVVEEE